MAAGPRTRTYLIAAAVVLELQLLPAMLDLLSSGTTPRLGVPAHARGAS